MILCTEHEHTCILDKCYFNNTLYESYLNWSDYVAKLPGQLKWTFPKFHENGRSLKCLKKMAIFPGRHVSLFLASEYLVVKTAALRAELSNKSKFTRVFKKTFLMFERVKGVMHMGLSVAP